MIGLNILIFFLPLRPITDFQKIWTQMDLTKLIKLNQIKLLRKSSTYSLMEKNVAYTVKFLL
jgi:hypothetical protein